MQQGAFKSNELISFALWSRSLSVTVYSNVSLTDKEVSNETELPDEEPPVSAAYVLGFYRFPRAGLKHRVTTVTGG